MNSIRKSLALSLFVFCALPGSFGQCSASEYGPAEYRGIQERLARGWNTWNTRSVLSHVLLPSGFAINLAFKQHYWLDEKYLKEALIGRSGEDAEKVRPELHAYDGSYTRLELEWEQLNVRVESATDGDDLVILLTPLSPAESPVKLIVEPGRLWNEERGGYCLFGWDNFFLAYMSSLESRDLLSWGSHKAKNPFHETYLESMTAAGYESGMVDEHFFNPEEFGGEWILPSIARSDPNFERQLPLLGRSFRHHCFYRTRDPARPGTGAHEINR
jgi:hypothetical protein